MPITAAALLAHQGGWDEALLVLGPIVVIVAALAVVKRRVDRMALHEPAPDAHADDGAPDSNG
jgi:hypothetical protein